MPLETGCCSPTLTCYSNRTRCGAQSHQKFLRDHVIPVAASPGFLFRPGVPEPHAVCRNNPGAWLVAASVWHSSGVDVLYLCRDIPEIGYSSLLFCSASSQHHAFCVYHAAFDLLNPCAGRSGLESNVLSTGGLAERHGVVQACGLWSELTTITIAPACSLRP